MFVKRKNQGDNMLIYGINPKEVIEKLKYKNLSDSGKAKLYGVAALCVLIYMVS